MRWSTVAVLAVIVFSGCNRSQYSAPDPFGPWGMRRVPPPATGSLGRPGGASPYYVPPSTTPGAAPNTGVHMTPASTGVYLGQPGFQPTGTSHTYPAGMWRAASSQPISSGGSSLQPSSQISGAPANVTVPAAMGAVVGSGLASHSAPPSAATAPPVASKLNPMYTNQGTVVAPPGLFSPPANAIEITQLPNQPGAANVAGNMAVRGQQPAAVPGGVAPASWTTPLTASTQATPAASSNPTTSPAGQTGSYGYQSDYSWLKGQLEYSATSKRWKLRYIPRDASEHRMDDFGGSVILPNPTQLHGFSPGEFVRVEGQLAGRDPSVVDFAPTYSILKIARQAN